MFFPAKPKYNTREQKSTQGESFDFPTVPTLLAVFITGVVGLILLVDQQLKPQLTETHIVAFDKSTRQVKTEHTTFLAPNYVDVGEQLTLQVSPITKTVVAYKLSHRKIVEFPRENIFAYWPITAIMTSLSFVLLLFWNRLRYRTELLVINLITVVVVLLFYISSS